MRVTDNGGSTVHSPSTPLAVGVGSTNPWPSPKVRGMVQVTAHVYIERWAASLASSYLVGNISVIGRREKRVYPDTDDLLRRPICTISYWWDDWRDIPVITNA